ncbi:class 1 fructose-bisphosphatase [Ilyomonas limi]|uniref:Fructose-1,6-bisphosphatase class 1 n=1 Tax=Ilyomonas limi TaxID=2575867 RepID=A0A4V5UVQ8_9BACT|nr:class 1 fructose-bisphosphatase [Ilyomonas limi]TKK65823.1 class 1 fructose-bisphosphatase [Ilyomonas limi]
MTTVIERKKLLTLDEFTIQQLRLFPNATGQLSSLMRDIGLAAKRINAEINKAGLLDIFGVTGDLNKHGEEVKKLDVFANNELTNVLKNGVSCAGVGSEEWEGTLIFDDAKSNQSKYVVLFDPLDGSSNIDNNICIGSIFGIYRRNSPVGSPCTTADFVQPGDRQIAAGYVIYGPSTVLVYATRHGVNGFTLDPAIGEFCLSHPDIICPANGSTYSINHSNFFQYSVGVRKYINDMQRWNEQVPDAFSQRYVGSMVADMHRTLLQGGIFLYPGNADKPQGKLRLMYECNPFAFIFEAAKGEATNGKQRILDIVPKELHQRSQFYCGSSNMINRLKQYLKWDIGNRRI